MFGDVAGIFDETGALVARYAYDVWGNCRVYGSQAGGVIKAGDDVLAGNHVVGEERETEITDPNHIGLINPWRWRSQYYDQESGNYYLAEANRYYDPRLGVVLNPTVG